MKLRNSSGYVIDLRLNQVQRLAQTDWLQTWRYCKGRELKNIALQYCAEHPEVKQQIASKHIEYEGKPEIKDCILNEELKYAKLLERASKLLTTLKPEELTGAKLCELHDTHGIDPCTAEDILQINLSNSVHDEYLKERKKLQANSRAKQKKEIITVKT